MPRLVEHLVAAPGIRPRSSRRSGGLLAVLLVGALLLCHGVFGFAHEVYCHECTSAGPLASMSTAAHDGQGMAHQADHAPGHDGAGGHALAGYFGTVLALFGVAMLGLLHGAWRRCAGGIPRRCRPLFLPVLARLPRGPTLPLLQEFRL